jgi:hypothetical protein
MQILNGFCFVVEVLRTLHDLRIDLLGHTPGQMGQTLVKTFGISNGSIFEPKGKVNGGNTLC